MNPQATNRRARLRSLKLEPQALSARAGRSYSYWRDLLTDESKSFGEKIARSIEESLGLPAMWLDEPIEARNASDSTEPYPSAGRDSPSKMMAHSMSYGSFHTPPTITWEEVLKIELPSEFVLKVPDDAIAAQHPCGTQMVFGTQAPLKPGKAVLVRDRSGELFVRIYGNVRGARWQALASNHAHATLDSETDGLTVVAVAMWVEA